MKTFPLVSVGIPTYNRPKSLYRTLKCITEQTYQNLEIIVSDNDSPGIDTITVINNFMKRDSRIKFYKQKFNIGMGLNFMFVLHQASGKYFMWAADDDIWESTFIETLVKKLQNNPLAVLAFSTYIYIDSKGKNISNPMNIEYSGKTANQRIKKFLFFYDDAHYYGIHITKNLKNVAKSYQYWGLNKNVYVNLAYVPLMNVLASGEFEFAYGKPLWFNTIDQNRDYAIGLSKSKKIVKFCANIIRNYNLFILFSYAVLRGSHSISITLKIMPLIFVRCTYNIVRGKEKSKYCWYFKYLEDLLYSIIKINEDYSNKME